MQASETELVRLIGELRIFSKYFREKFMIGKAYSCPFRKDTKPSFVVYKDEGDHWYKYKWKDFGTNAQGDCIELVMKLYTLSREGAMSKITKDFNIDPSLLLAEDVLSLILECIGDEVKDNTYSTYESDIEMEEYKPFQYSYTKKGAEDYDYEYWSQYGIDVDKLEHFGVHCVDEVLISAHPYKDKFIFKKSSKKTPIYVYEINDRYKLYMPYSMPKFLGTVKGKDMHIHIEYDSTLCLIVKSLKDLMLYNSMGFNALSIQSENTYVSKSHIIDSTYPNLDFVIIYDNDEPGIKAAKELSRRTGFRYIQLPIDTKDPTDYIKQHGITALPSLKDIILNTVWNSNGKKSNDGDLISFLSS